MAINTQELRGQWNKLQGRVKERWGQLTDDDLQIQGGNVDQLVGRIQQKTGEGREAIEKFLAELTRAARPPSSVRPMPSATTPTRRATGSASATKVGGHGPPQPGRGLRHRPGGRPDHRAGDPTPLSRARRFDGPLFVTDPRETIGTLRHAPELAEGNRYR